MLVSAKRRTLFGCDARDLIRQSGGVEQAGVDVGGLKHRIGVQHSLAGGALGQHGQHHRRRDAAAQDHGLATHLAGFGRDARKELCVRHPAIMPSGVATGEAAPADRQAPPRKDAAHTNALHWGT